MPSSTEAVCDAELFAWQKRIFPCFHNGSDSIFGNCAFSDEVVEGDLESSQELLDILEAAGPAATCDFDKKILDLEYCTLAKNWSQHCRYFWLSGQYEEELYDGLWKAAAKGKSPGLNVITKPFDRQSELIL